MEVPSQPLMTPEQVPAPGSSRPADAVRPRLRAVPASTQPVVLVAQHNRISQRLLVSLLSRRGYDPCLSMGPHQAFEMIQRHPGRFVMAILDLRDPLAGELDELRACKARMGEACPPLIVLGNNPSPDARAACRDAGADFYLTDGLRDGLLSRAVDFIAHSRLPMGFRLPQRSEPAPSLLDDATVERLLSMGEGGGFLEEVFRDLRDDVREHLWVMDRALKRQDYALWRSGLHALKGAALSAGAALLAELCIEGEALCQQALQAGLCLGHLARIRRAWEETQTALQQIIEDARAQRVSGAG